MLTSVITQKGQITLPAELRKKLGLRVGQQVAFSCVDNIIEIKPIEQEISAAFGLLKAERGVSDEAMEAAIRDAAGSE